MPPRGPTRLQKSTQMTNATTRDTRSLRQRHATFSCFVRDLSQRGARLEVEGSVNAPDAFDSLINLEGLEAKWELVWRACADFGVKIITRASQTTPRHKEVIALPERKPLLRRKRIKW